MLPVEPVEIGTAPQFVFDTYIIDNRWAIKYHTQSMRCVFHQPQKYAGNPVIAGDGGYVALHRDAKSGLFQMWYQTYQNPPEGEKRVGRYAIAYAESKDGISWQLPRLNLYSWKGSKENNIVWTGINGRRGGAPFFPDIPEANKQGYRHVMLYRETDGMHLIGSQDGIHWDRESNLRISPIRSDTINGIVYDSRTDQYVMYCRSKNLYRAFKGDILDTGASRRIARMTSKELWTKWTNQPQHIMLPDNLDTRNNFRAFYGMAVKRYGGIYWGFLQAFKWNSDVHTELAFSRDTINFNRLPSRPKFIELGPDGSWDDGMVFSGHEWFEVGDEWWMYYCGWDGPHNSRQRVPGIGLVKLRKEGFISMRGPKNGGVLNTRQLLWPGGELVVNANAVAGEFKVRVTDVNRKVLPGFDYGDCEPLQGDHVAHQVRWKERSINELAGKVVRIEFFLRNADLYTFRAATASEQPAATE